MIKAFLRPTGLHSPAMLRVSAALAAAAPPSVELVAKRAADLVLLHVISPDAIAHARELRAHGCRYAVAQYCLGSTSLPARESWYEFWRGAEMVWSYYDLTAEAADLGFKFYHSPLGVDEVFRGPITEERRPMVVTTGTVSGPGAEPIEEVWQAANEIGLGALHVGPAQVVGMDQPANWRSVSNISDRALAKLYQSATWVSGLRHVEGFELPAAEGLCCGARPIMFRQPAIEHWYGDTVECIKENSGEELVRELVSLIQTTPRVVTAEERERTLGVFNWVKIARGFWGKVMGR